MREKDGQRGKRGYMNEKDRNICKSAVSLKRERERIGQRETERQTEGERKREGYVNDKCQNKCQSAVLLNRERERNGQRMREKDGKRGEKGRRERVCE